VPDDLDQDGGRNRGEDEKERVDRELIELLNELRVALPGVQVLFAFLLTVPFSQGFSKVTTFQRDVYFAAFLATALATALMIAPTTYHRIHFRAHNKERLLLTSNKLSLVGSVFLAIAIGTAVFFVTDVLFKVATASIVTGLISAWFGWFWYGLPLLRRFVDSRQGRGGADG
jgi:uncharacterized membrane protein